MFKQGQDVVSHELASSQARDNKERLWFEQQPTVDDFSYVMHPSLAALEGDHAGAKVRERMLEAREAAEDTYYTEFVSPDKALANEKPIYVLAGPVNLSDEMSLQGLASLLHVIRTAKPDLDARINIASYFKTDKPPQAEKVQEFDDENGCNTIYADDAIDSGRHMAVTAKDLLDNIVCETIRAKYRAVRDTSHEAAYHLAEGKRASANTITELRRIFSEYKLWHRASTDGAILINHEDNLLVSQTQSSKSMIVPKRFSLVTGTVEVFNQLSFAGERLPSSDSPELVELIENIKEDGEMEVPQLILHFHHPTLTRSGKFPEYTTKDEIEYGRFESGRKIYKELKSKQTNWLILKNHGFIWLGNTPEEFEQFVKYITSLCW